MRGRGRGRRAITASGNKISERQRRPLSPSLFGHSRNNMSAIFVSFFPDRVKALKREPIVLLHVLCSHYIVSLTKVSHDVDKNMITQVQFQLRRSRGKPSSVPLGLCFRCSYNSIFHYDP